MKKLMIAVFVFALSLGLYASDKSKSSSKAPAAAKTASLTGCVEGSAGSYMVKKGSKDVPVTSSEDLAGHVGHKVKLTGTWEKGADAKSKTFNATKVDMVSESCHAKAAKSTTHTAKKTKS
jgi:hypothetical protein